MMIPDIAVGAIVAAVIGAMISLAGLVVAKESKVSEFRQAWIDSLRKELALFVSNINSLTDANQVKFKDRMDRFEKLSEPTSKLNEAYYSIALRLNITESSASAVRNSMVKLAGMATSPENFDIAAFNSERVEFINASNALLKDEWRRVKAGEKAYRVTRIVAASLIGLLMLAVVIIVAVGLTKKNVGEKAVNVATQPFPSRPPTPAKNLDDGRKLIKSVPQPVIKVTAPAQSQAADPALGRAASSRSSHASSAP